MKKWKKMSFKIEIIEAVNVVSVFVIVIYVNVTFFQDNDALMCVIFM